MTDAHCSAHNPNRQDSAEHWACKSCHTKVVPHNMREGGSTCPTHLQRRYSACIGTWPAARVPMGWHSREPINGNCCSYTAAQAGHARASPAAHTAGSEAPVLHCSTGPHPFALHPKAESEGCTPTKGARAAPQTRERRNDLTSSAPHKLYCSARSAGASRCKNTP